MSAMTDMLVDRCHVADTNRQVIRYVISRTKVRTVKRFVKAMPKRDRRQMYQEIIARHEQNWQLYAAVMMGGR